ncbi:MAG TPA: hypothetical protein VMV75_07155 [Sulfuricella sp.]|nr:hypothetical protein [Sulfuricella sp.]
MTSRKPNIPMQELLEARQNALRQQQAEKSTNKLADKQNRWQRFNRFVWDKRRG